VAKITVHCPFVSVRNRVILRGVMLEFLSSVKEYRSTHQYK